ncbi:Glucosamine-6-phosphate isomerase (Glucosamine-6-phosphate deaminase) (GNPDA) (GlcN6P deaminase) [Ceratobasidium sp. 394]|nr:Glucosamine-6-phosphate isomerase (Glucosamine-6-phosphate deaminase) (GNPDA) (GlcN6P deaminase) [Ceratobasidium sp. 394]
MASTVGVGTVLDSRGVIAVVTGLRQGLPLRKKTIVWIEEGMNHSAGNNQKQRDWRVVHWTLPALQIHSWSLVVCDKDTAELRTKTSGIIMDRVAYPRGAQPQGLSLPKRRSTRSQTAWRRSYENYP